MATPPIPRTGRFAVHVASVGDAAEVGAEWRRLAQRHPSLAALGHMPPQRVEIAGKGTFHRLLAGPFATRAEAQAACDRLRKEGRYCSVMAP